MSTVERLEALATRWREGGWNKEDARERLLAIFSDDFPRFDARDKEALACLLAEWVSGYIV
jgi:hypothetical protein